MVKYIVPAWIATRSYLVDTPDSRTIISNNKTHKIILLEDVSSDLYAYLVSNSTNLEEFARAKDIEQTLPGFLEELRENQLLVLDTDFDDGKGEPTSADDIYVKVGEDAQTPIEAEISRWCFERGFLFSLFIEMTYKCNLKCIHCYNPKGDFASQLSLEDARRIIDEAASIGCFNLTLSGGECTLDADFLEIVSYARKQRFNLSIFTNGQSLYKNPAFLEEIAKLYPYRVGISIYSATPEIHDKVTGVAGSFDKSLCVLKRLKEFGVNTEVKCVQLSESAATWQETLQLAREYNSSATFDITLTPTTEGNTKTWAHSVSDEMLMELYTNPDSPMFIGNFEGRPVNIDLDGPCFAGTKTLCVTPALDLMCCISLPIKFGNLRSRSLADIWNEATKNKRGKLHEWQNITLSAFKDCFQEEHCRFCNFCAGMGMLEDKLYSKSTELCRIAKIKMQAFRKLKGATQ